MADKLVPLSRLAAAIPAGARLAVPADYAGPAVAATLELIRLNRGGLRLVTAPTSGLQADLLIGAGLVAEIETAGISLGEYGQAERFRAAWAEGRVKVTESTCPALHAGFQAAEKGVPFLPLRGILGSDLPRLRPDWRIIQNPMTEEPDPILLVAAVRPDVALFHARLADRFGNVWVGLRRELSTLAHASAHTLVTAEEIYPGNLLEDPKLAAGSLSRIYVDAVAHVPGGGLPESQLQERYAQASRTPQGFAALLEEWLHG